MSEDIKAVETEQTAAPAPGVEQVSEAPQEQSQEVDFAAEYEALLAENKRIEAEKENYRRGLLKAKGKVFDDEPLEEAEDMESLIERKVQEKLLETQEARNAKAREAIIEQALKENRELKLSLQTRSQITNSSQGTHNETQEVNDTFFTKEQLEYFKKRNLDPERVKANMLKNKR